MERVSTELYNAAASGKVAALDDMQKRNIDIFALVFSGRNTALHISAFHGRVDFVERLLQLIKEKSDEEAQQLCSFLRAQNEEENTALCEAVKGGDHAQIVDMLNQADAELADIRNNKGESPLFIASANGRLDALNKLLGILLSKEDPHCYARFDGQTCLHHALFYHKNEVAETLIKTVPDFCKQADYFLGRTPLHIAALRGCTKSIVQKLLRCDASLPFTRDKIKQQTALQLAAEHGRLDIVRCILKSAGDCVEIKDENGKTALHYAVENARVGVVSYLAYFARVINIADKNGYTALDIANQKYDEEPLFSYFAIRWFLRTNNAMEGAEAADQTRETSKPFPSEGKYSTTISGLSICAILIATVTFQAAFTMPPHKKDKVDSFESFVWCDFIAFCLSMAAAILLAYGTFFRRHRGLIVGVSAFILSSAFYTMMFTFSFAIFAQISQDNHKLAALLYNSMLVFAPTSFAVVLLVLYHYYIEELKTIFELETIFELIVLIFRWIKSCVSSCF